MPRAVLNEGVPFCSVRAMLNKDRRGGRDAEGTEPDAEGECCVLPVTRGPGSRRVHRGGEEKGGGRARGGGGDRGSVWGEQGFVGGCTTVGI